MENNQLLDKLLTTMEENFNNIVKEKVDYYKRLNEDIVFCIKNYNKEQLFSDLDFLDKAQ